MGHTTENVELTVLCLIQDGNRILLQGLKKTGKDILSLAVMWNPANLLWTL